MKRCIRSLPCALLAISLYLAPPAAVAQEPPAASGRALELIERERIRSSIETAFNLAASKSGNGAQDLDNLMRATHDLSEIGDAAIPFLINELDQSSPVTFFFCAYALGHFDTPEATAALERALERADSAPGDFGLSRKGWSGYGLALQGKAAAIDMLNEGARRASHISIHGDVMVVEAMAILTAPDSVPLLIAQLDEYAKREWWTERRYTLAALGRVLDERAIPAVVAVLDDEDPAQRRAAALALRRAAGNADAVAALARAIGDDDFRVRRAAARSLQTIGPQEHIDTAIARLAEEDDAVVRGRIYGWIVAARGPAALEMLRPYWPSDEADDRFQLMVALESLASPDSLDILETAAVDPDSRVMARALSAIARIDTEAGDAILRRQLLSTFWPRAQSCIEHLAHSASKENGRALADRLLKVELATKVTDPRLRHRLELLGNSIVSVGYTAALPELRKQLELQEDVAMLTILKSTVGRLEQLERNRRSVARWTAAANSDERELRELAYLQLSRIGGKKSAEAMVSSFGRTAVDEGVVLLDLLGEVDRPEVRELIRRVLVDPSFDGVDYWPLRDMAGWSARRLGGPDMVAALRDAAVRRDGRDAMVLAYLAIAAGEEALPTLRELRIPRMRYLKYTRGYEYESFDRMIANLSAGRSVDRWDRRPGLLDFR